MIRVLMDPEPFVVLSARNSICIVRSAQPRVTRLPGLSRLRWEGGEKGALN